MLQILLFLIIFIFFGLKLTTVFHRRSTIFYKKASKTKCKILDCEDTFGTLVNVEEKKKKVK